MLESQMLPPTPIPLACSKTIVGASKAKACQQSAIISNENIFEINGEMEHDDVSVGHQEPPRLHSSPESLGAVEEEPIASYNNSPANVEQEDGQDNVVDSMEDRDYDDDKRIPPQLSPSDTKLGVGCAKLNDGSSIPSENENDTMLTAGDLHNKPIDGYHTEPTTAPMPQRVGSRTTGAGGGKPCAKKSFVWKYFNHPTNSDGMVDRGRTQCILCNSQLAFNASGTTTTMLNHLKSRHGDIAEHEETQRRYTRPHKPVNRNSMSNTTSNNNGLEASEDQLELDMKSHLGEDLHLNRSLFSNSVTRVSRNSLSVGQRGRPPGSGRRPRINKTGLADSTGVAMDYLDQAGHAMRNNSCAGNPENSVNFFPLNYCNNLTEQQQYALLTEMIRSAETAASKENTSLTSPGHMLLSNLAAVGINPGYHPLFQPPPPPPINFDRGLPPLPLATPGLGNNSVQLDPHQHQQHEDEEGLGKLNGTKPTGKAEGNTPLDNGENGVSSALVRNPLLSSPCAGLSMLGCNPLVASWSSVPADLPLSLLSMPGPRPGQDLSSSSTSSGLGVGGSLSTVSPLATSTLTVSPPSSVSSGGQNMGSPAGQQPGMWGVKHDQYQQQSSGANGRRENGIAEVATPGHTDGNIYAANNNSNGITTNDGRHSPIPLLFNAATTLRTASTKSTSTGQSNPSPLVNSNSSTDLSRQSRMNLHGLGLFSRPDCPTTRAGDSSLAQFSSAGLNLPTVMSSPASGAPGVPSTLSGPPGTDLASAFGRFMNLMPNMMGGGIDCVVPYSSSPSSTSQQSFNNYAQQATESLGLLPHQNTPHHQQQQQLMAANAWLASLANGCPPGALMDQSTVLSLLTSSVVNTGQNPMALKRTTTATGYKENCLLPMSFSASVPDTDSKTTDSVTACPQPPPLGNFPTCQDPLEAAGSQLIKCALNGLTGAGGWPSPFQFPPNSVSVGSFPITTHHDTLVGGVKQGSQLKKTNSAGSFHADNLYESLDLSKPGAVVEGSAPPTSDGTPSPGLVANSNDQADSGMATPASMKRKRARPVYISPNQPTKRRPTDVESATSWTGDSQEERPAGNPRRLNDEAVDGSNSGNTTQSQLGQLVHGQFVYQLAQFLVKDMRPPELLEGKGFLELMSIMTNHAVPTASEMRNDILAKLATTVTTDLPGLLASAVQQETNQSDKIGSGTSPKERSNGTKSEEVPPSASQPLPPSIAVAMSVELWSTMEASGSSVEVVSPDGDRCHSNVEVHYCCPPSCSLTSRFYQSVKLKPQVRLPDILTQCRSVFLTGQSSTNWPCPLVTNRPTRLIELLRMPKPSNGHLTSSNPSTTTTTTTTNTDELASSEDLKSINTETDEAVIHPQFMVVPCLVSELARAVMSGLRLPEVEQTLKHCQQELAKKSIQESESAVIGGEDNTGLMDVDKQPVDSSGCKSSENKSYNQILDSSSELPQTWSEIEALLKRVSISGCRDVEKSGDVIKQLLGVLGTMNETLELIHRDDLVLTASMIEPILQNLRQTRLAPSEDTAGLVESVKAAILGHLNRAYPETGQLQQCLQLASLLDPRFKDHVEEQSPAAVKLLKSKLDQIPESTGSRKCSEMGRETGDHKAVVEGITGGRDGLKSVFGMPCISRVSHSEADRYLREDPVGLETDPLEWWVERASSYPRLARLAVYYLTIPLTCFSKGRLRPVKTDPMTLNRTPVGDSMTFKDGLGLPNVFDSLGSLRQRIDSGDFEVYTFLWHNWELTKPF